MSIKHALERAIRQISVFVMARWVSKNDCIGLHIEPE